MAESAVPHTLAEITPAWLSRALAPVWPNVEVAALEIADVIAATATKARLRVSYAHDVGAPTSLVIKGGLFGHEHERALAPLYHNEAMFYRDVAPELPVEVPFCHGVVADATDGIVVMEDLELRGARFGEGRTPLTVDEVADGLAYQARYHATYWGRANQLGTLGLMDLAGFLTAFFGGLAPHFTIEEHGHHDASTLAAVREAQGALVDRGRFAEAVLTNWERNAAEAPCLIHFDTHAGNMYFTPEGAPGWLDWQLTGAGHWAWDVAYFLIGAMTPEDRRLHERDLLEVYRGRLSQSGIHAPGADDAWAAYRRNAIWGLSWTLVPDVMQQSHNAYPIIERFLLAIRELETMSALGLRAGGVWSG
jgi:hypothetical protein